MTEVRTRDIPLNWDVFVTPGIPFVTSDLPPGMKQRRSAPMSSTLIYGQRDAVLVDALLTVEQAHALVDWVAASGKNLTTIRVGVSQQSDDPKCRITAGEKATTRGGSI